MNINSDTPVLTVIDSRNLPVCQIAYHRLADNVTASERATRQSYDAASRLNAQQDPRLPHANLTTLYSLSGQVLLTDSVDTGWRLALLGEAGQIIEQWDGRGSHRQTTYDDLLRPIAINEEPVGARLARESISQTTHPLTVERFTYGGPDASEHNQCNQPTRHDDPAGTLRWPDYSLLGSPVSEIRRFLLEPVTPHWPTPEPGRDELLEPAEYASAWSFNALGETLEQTDAMGNSQHFAQTIAGQLKSVSVTLADSAQADILVSEIHYNAFDQVEQETAGNGVISHYQYDLRDGRLSSLKAALANQSPLQDLRYDYDPVGNILQIEDAAQPVQFFASQRIDPINHYRYDTLYQLIEATGREVKTGSSHGPALPDMQNLPPDPNQVANYTQNYEYDAAGNLLQMRHVGAQSFTRTMLVAPDSNRSLPEGEVDVDFETGFDANGNLQQLIRGQDLRWDVRNQLREVTAVKRDDGPDDSERYLYDGGGQRCRKIRSAQSRNRTLIEEVRYLPGLELRTGADGEILHIISVSAGRHNVRVLHWQTNTPAQIGNDQLRYSLNDHLGSSTLELDHQGGLISQESYYPFGGTAWWAARSATEAKYKTIRYSGKERDASGLYYYGFRYYAPWLQRWINPDPAGDVDGLNIFIFVHNRPVTLYDNQGEITTHFDDKGRKFYRDPDLINRLENFKLQHAEQFNVIDNQFRHAPLGSSGLYSVHRPVGAESFNYFSNKFRQSKWTFEANYKRIQTEPIIYADHVAVAQYLRISKSKFEGALPSTIKRTNIINETTKEIVHKYKDSSEKLKINFLTQTPNGKSTQRILDTFQLRPLAVRAVYSGSEDLDIYIDVEPKALSATETTTAPAIVLPVRTADSRFSVTPVLPQPPTSRFRVTPVNPSTSQSRFTVTPSVLDPTSPQSQRRNAI